MTTYIDLAFIPGSAGNFFSRCLNLLDNAYVFAERKMHRIPIGLNEKLALLSYSAVESTTFADRNWIEFETILVPVTEIIEHTALPKDSYLVWFRHPDAVDCYGLIGPSDRYYSFYIDPGEHMRWCVMNALYKNSYLSSSWLINGKKLANDPAIYKIKLGSFIGNTNEFLKEFEQVCEIIGHTLSNDERDAVAQLHSQWKLTTLDYDQIDDFKNYIGLSF